MNCVFSFQSSAYYFEITVTVPDLTPSNKDIIPQTAYTPTVTRTSTSIYSTGHTYGALTRYFRLEIGTNTSTKKVIGTYKVTFAAKTATTISQQKGTVTKTMSSPPSIGDCMKYYVSLNTSVPMVICEWGASTSYTLDDGHALDISGWKLSLDISHNLTSNIDSTFGKVVGFCNWTSTMTNSSVWTYTAGTESDKRISIPIRTLRGVNNTLIGTDISVGTSVTYNFGTVGVPSINTYFTAVNEYVHQSNIIATSVSVQSYSKPEITSCSVVRNSSNSEQADLSITYKLHSLNKTSDTTSNITVNSAVIKYQFYKGTTTYGSEGTITIVSNNSTLSSLTGTKTATYNGGTTSPLDVNESYTCKVWVVDRLGGTSTVQEITIPTEFRTIDFKAGGTGVAIGEVASKDGFEVAMPSMFITMAGTIQMTACPAGGPGNTPLVPANNTTIYEPIPGWLICNGAAVSRTTYKTLFDVIQTNYGSGDGSNTFNLPDLRGRMPLGGGPNSANTVTTYGSCSASTINQSLGAKGGEAAHKLLTGEAAQKEVTTGNMSANSTHDHEIEYNVVYRTTASSSGGVRNVVSGGSSKTSTLSTSVQHTHSITGSDATTAHNNIQPYTVVNYIICTGQLPS